LPADVVFPLLRVLRTPVDVGPHSDRPPGRPGSLASHPDHERSHRSRTSS
jgi:hypothetical protein